MAKRRTPRAVPAVALDHGPAIRRKRGEVVVPDKPRADPDRPKGVGVLGAEIRCLYHVLWDADLITDDQHEAADKLLVACEAESGGQERGPEGMHVRRAPWDRAHPALRRLQASRDLMDARAALGLGCYENTLSAVCSIWPVEWGGACPKDADGLPDWLLLSKDQLDHLRASLQILVLVWRINA